MEYTDSGVPIPPYITRTNQWHKKALAIRSDISCNSLIDIQNGLHNLTKATDRLRLNSSATVSPTNLYNDTIEVQQSLQFCRRALIDAIDTLDKFDEKGLDEYTETFRKEANGDKQGGQGYLPKSSTFGGMVLY